MATAGKSLATPLTSDTQATYYKDATELAALIRTKQRVLRVGGMLLSLDILFRKLSVTDEIG